MPAVVVVLAAGLLLRGMQYLLNRSLWLDEVLMVPGILGRPLGEALHPTGWGAVPPGFTLLTWLSARAFGDHEMALRLVPFLAGLVSLLVATVVARRVLSRGGAALAVALFALSPFLIYYSSELKQYSTDVLVTLLLLAVAVPLLREATLPRIAAWGVATVAAALFSLPSVFVSASMSLVLAARLARTHDRIAAIAMAGVAAAWAGATVMALGIAGSGVAANPYLQRFWESGFLPLRPRSIQEWGWLPHAFLRVFRDPLGVNDDTLSASAFYQPAAGMLAFAAGVLHLLRRDGWLLALLLAPIGVTLVASAARVYPFGADLTTGGRVLLFLLPVFFLLMAEGGEQLRRALSRSALKPLGWAVIALLVLPYAVHGMLAVPYGRVEIKPILEVVRQHRAPGDVLFVHYDLRHEFRHYAPRYDLGGASVVFGPCARIEPVRYLEALSEIEGPARLWLLVGAGSGVRLFDERRLLLSYLDARGPRIDERFALGASVHLYELGPGTIDARALRMSVPRLPELIEEGCAIWGGE